MADESITRRRFTEMAAAVTTIGIPECLGDLRACIDEIRAFDPRGPSADGPDKSGGPSDEAEPSDEIDTSEEDSPDETETASVRVVHASPDAPNIDVYVDGELILENVPFRTANEYLPVSAGTYEIEITVAGGSETVIFSDELSFESGTATTLAAIGELDAETFEVRRYVDDLSPVPDGETRITALHVSPSAPDIDVAVSDSDELLFMDLMFGDASESTTVPPGAYTLDIRPAGERHTVETFDIDLEPETAYTVFAMGYLVPESTPTDESFDLTLAVDTRPGVNGR